MNKTLEYIGLRPSPLASKTKTTKMEKLKLNITLKVLNVMSAEFPDIKHFIEKHLKQKYLKENVSVE